MIAATNLYLAAGAVTGVLATLAAILNEAFRRKGARRLAARRQSLIDDAGLTSEEADYFLGDWSDR